MLGALAAGLVALRRVSGGGQWVWGCARARACSPSLHTNEPGTATTTAKINNGMHLPAPPANSEAHPLPTPPVRSASSPAMAAMPYEEPKVRGGAVSECVAPAPAQ